MDEEQLNHNFYELETLNKISFQKEKYVFLDLDWSSTLLWDKNHYNIPLEWMDWDTHSKLYLLKACNALDYVYNSRPIPYNESDNAEGYFGSEYLTEEILNISIGFKDNFPDWTIQIHDNFSNESLTNSAYDNFITINEETDRVALINQRRSLLLLNPGFITKTN